ncbi:hypothetical protein TIFTF001_029195 [Ficus carica]|uniref:Uncharacterized protein n=1 Tax=Ficus carica TaxID=3494 RepID=A0AA88DRC5_FICCA|nr:hypothetical protein TIFTF001_029195 [Ficus carica]
MKEITTVTYLDRRGLLGRPRRSPWRPSWSLLGCGSPCHDGLARRMAVVVAMTI